MADNIKALLIFEMLGRPADYLKETLIKFIDKVSQEDGIEILDKKFHEPKKVEDAKSEIFTTFAEVEINFKDINSLLKIVFVYMPSHVEIIDPDEIRIKNFDLNTLMNELARKLHQYDEVAKRLNMEREILQRQLEQQGVKPAIPQLQAQLKKPKEKSKKVNRKVNKSKKKKSGKKKR